MANQINQKPIIQLKHYPMTFTLLYKDSILKKRTLVGHAMGGMTALHIALNHPDKVSKLVLVGTTAKQSLSMRLVFMDYDADFLRMNIQYR